jgi:predicted solute-binding protein
MKPRVCAVSYLNTVPLVWGFEHGPQRGMFDLTYRVPSACADDLAAGRADIGIVPCAELERLQLQVIPGAGIACRGAVRSILLVTKKPPQEIRSLAADSSSRSSVMLARIVLARRYGAEPAVATHAPDLAAMLDTADAALLIGDPALRATCPPHCSALDLGAEWAELTGLPMVFAVWACRAGLDPEALAPAFLDSCRYGLAHLEEIVAREAPTRGLPIEVARDYLTRRIVLEIGPRERDGMARFLEYARQFGTVGASA